MKEELKNKLMSMISQVQYHYHEGSPMSKDKFRPRWEGFVEKVGFGLRVKE